MIFSSPDSSLLILGRGYVGSEVARLNPLAHSTRRKDFELERRETWTPEVLAVPKGGNVLWCFPAAGSEKEEDLALQLYDQYFKQCQTIVYGTTSAYLAPETDGWIDETSPLNLTHPRTRTEEELRKRGACILHLSGIFGPGRDPLNWYKNGLIKHGRSYLNLIHLRDIVAITQRMFKEPSSFGKRFNLSNGQPKTHSQIVLELKEKGLLSADFSLPETHKPESKKVGNQKIKIFLKLKDEDFIGFP